MAPKRKSSALKRKKGTDTDTVAEKKVKTEASSNEASTSSSLRGEKETDNGKVAKKKVKTEASGDEVTTTKSSLKTVVIKGKAPVDAECKSKVNCAHIYCEGNDIYDAMLNQTNLQFNNNKYYLLQLLEDDKSKSYSVWFRWGRVGKSGQSKLESYGGNLDAAKQSFFKKFSEKTRNEWSDRKNFQKIPGKYDLLEMDYSTEEATNSKSTKVKNECEELKIESKLPEKVQSLVTLICDVKVMEDAVLEMQYDSKKAPLGRLNKDQIKQGYLALQEIQDAISEKNRTKSSSNKDILRACNDFYTRIPHDFGMKVPPLITNPKDVKIKLELLQALEDIEIAMNILKKPSNNDNPIDRHYKSLECEIESLDVNSELYKMVNTYLQNTHASTHKHYQLELVEVFSLNKPKEVENFKDFGNKMLLWHGSRMSNWVGILSQGLRIAPPEAPSTGYMFGKGIYFADMSSKSCNYVYPTRAKNEGLVVLCEVSLGQSRELLDADYDAHKLPPGMHSVKGKGSVAPDPSKNHKIDGDVTVPMGKPIKTKVDNPMGYTLNYNEYIVYNPNQVKMRFAVKVKFNFK